MKKVVFIGQAMPNHKRTPHHWPILNTWHHSIGITDNQIESYFLYTALVDYFPGYQKIGGHKVPTQEEIKKESGRLKKIVIDFDPEIIVTIGKLSLSYCLNKKIDKLDKDYIGKSFSVNPYGFLNKNILVIPFPHPSGASTWKYKKGNKILLAKALNILKEEMNKNG